MISKCLFGISNSSKNKKNQLNYYGTSSQIVFLHFLEELKTAKRHFKIKWPLTYKVTVVEIRTIFSIGFAGFFVQWKELQSLIPQLTILYTEIMFFSLKPWNAYNLLKSVHFKKTVARSSVLSKLRSFLIIHQLTSKRSQLMNYWKLT